MERAAKKSVKPRSSRHWRRDDTDE
jgi:hypothetical protein